MLLRCFVGHGCCFASCFEVLITVPSRLLLEQFGQEFPEFCKVGTGFNKHIDFGARGFLAVTDSVHRLRHLNFRHIFSDEAHHPIPAGLPNGTDLFKFSATHTDEVDFRYSMGEAIEDGVLSDYDLTVPVTTKGHPYRCLASLLLSQAGRFRRVLAYCNSIQQSKRFQQVLLSQGIAAWQMDGRTRLPEREEVMAAFLGPMQKVVHVLVTVQVLGEGVNIPNADTCLFVEPRSSYTSIIQAVGRVLRNHGAKPLAHVVLPAVAAGAAEGERSGTEAPPDCGQGSCKSPGASKVISHTPTVGADKGRADGKTGRQAYRYAALQRQADSEQQLRRRPNTVHKNEVSTKAPKKQVSLTNTSRYTAKPVEHEVELSAISAVPGTAPSTERFVSEAQLERFMAALAEADNRLQTQPVSSRVCVIDSRLGDSKRLPFRSQVRTVFRRMSQAIARPYSWQERFEALETFAAENGRLPLVRAVDKRESSLAKWLANVGLKLNMGKLAAERTDMLLHSASDLVRSRVQTWLDQDLNFKQKCEHLQRFIRANGAIPTKRQVRNKDSEEYRLAMWLAKLRAGTMHMSPQRFQILTCAHPLLADLVSRWDRNKIALRLDLWMKRAQVLKKMVSLTGRLPSQTIPEERKSYLWMVVQKHRFRFLPDSAQAELLTSPIVAAFLRQG